MEVYLHIVYHLGKQYKKSSRIYRRVSQQTKQTKMYLSRYEEIKMPKFLVPRPDENAKIVKEMKYKEGDILVCAYPKSGNNWTETLIRCLLRRDKNEDILAKPSIIDLSPPQLFTTMPSPRVFFTHLWPKRIPKEHVEKRGKMVMMLRNPKDVVVASYYHYTRVEGLKYTHTWDEHFEAFINGEVFFGDIFDYLKNWEEALKSGIFDIKHFFYEDLKTKPVETLKGIAEHIGVSKKTDELAEIVNECSIQNMKKLVCPDRLHFTLTDKNKDYVLLRKGEIGDWKNHFTVAQAERFDKILKEKMGDSMFKFVYE